MTQSSIWASSDPGNVKGGGQRELSNVVTGPHPVRCSLTGQRPSAQTIGTLYKRRSHVATGEISSSHLLSNMTAHILTRLQRDAMFWKSTCLKHGKKRIWQNWCGKLRYMDWTGLTLVHGPKARLSSTSKRYFGRSGLSQLY